MAKLKLRMVVIMAVMVASLPFSRSKTEHVVGNGLGWIIPAGGSDYYIVWASQETFNVDDVLVFDFVTGTHNVEEVSEVAYDSCDTTNPISITNVGPARFALSAGSHYCLCGIEGHCIGGQKLAINVSLPPADTMFSS